MGLLAFIGQYRSVFWHTCPSCRGKSMYELHSWIRARDSGQPELAQEVPCGWCEGTGRVRYSPLRHRWLP